VLRATFVYLFVTLYVLVMAPMALAWTILSRETRLIYGLARVCIRIAGWMSGVKVRVRGRERILPGQNYVFLSNHGGNFDGPVLFYAIPRDIRALIKKEMMRLPVLSLVLKQVQFVPIDRTDPIQARASIDRGATLLNQGHSFIAFPEGTRSRDGRLGAFKKGVFIMALKAGTPVMPVTVLGSSHIQPPGAYGIRPGTVEVIFHDSIATAGMKTEDRDRLIEMTRGAIASGFADARCSG